MTDKEKDIIETEEPKKGYLSPDENEVLSPEEQIDNPDYSPADKLRDMVAIITGADSGIGAATAVAFAKEGAKLVLTDLDNEEDAEKVRTLCEKYGAEVVWLTGDVGDEDFAQTVIDKAVQAFGQIDILVNNAAQQLQQESIMDITAAQLDRTFRTNIFAMFYFVKAAMPHFTKGARIINSTSVTAYRGSPNLLDYASTKGAILAFTRSLAQNQEILDKKIRVNAVAPGPIWTPLIPATTGRDKEEHGGDQPLGRAGESYECAPAYVYLASDDSSYVTGQTIHVNGGEIVNG
ncbi:SDR family oxidoreductase [Jeotgalibaca sp. A122]|uniref:SDR family oxidoreductase n=1 Tax=Jeotgalibaca sp. A122 TaxID=3457322 RepID=UPI003FD0A285